MSKKIYGSMEVKGNLQTNGKNVIRDVADAEADSSGNVNLYYTKEYIDKVVKVLPISRVGTMDYLPMSINGSFEGATNYIGKGILPIIMENDGTMVYLRPGTNGSTFGYYYCYSGNNINSTALNPVQTNEKYTPPYFTSNHKLNSFIGSNAQDVIMVRTNNGTIDTYGIILTNGTLNRSAHQGVEFPASLISNTDPQYAMVHNGIVYIFGLSGYQAADEFAISVYTISVQNVKDGVYTSLTQVTGFNGSNLYGDQITNSTNIKLTPMYFSADLNDKPLITIPPGNVYRGISIFWGNEEGSIQAAGSGNNIRILFAHACETATQQTNTRTMTGISLVFNTNTKSYTFDSSANAPITITTSSSGVITYDNPFFFDMQNLSCLALTSSLNRVPSIFVSNDGLSLCALARHDTFTEHMVSRGKISSFTSLYDSWNIQNRVLTNRTIASIYPTYGSAIGDNLIHPTIISKDKIFLCCSGSQDGTYFGLDNTVVTGLGTTRTYPYKSVISGNTLNGFAPNVDRKLLDNTDRRYSNMITIMDGTGNTTVYGTSFIENFTKFSGGVMDQDSYTFNDSYTTSPTLLSTLKQDVITQQLSNIVYNTTNSYIIMYYVPDTTFTKSYAVVTGITDAPTGQANTYLLLAELDLVSTGNNITSYTIVSTRYITRSLPASIIRQAMLNRQPGLIIAKYDDFTYVGIPSHTSVVTAADNLSSLICKVDNSTKLITGTPKMIPTGYNSSSNNMYEVGVLPGIGFGLFENGDITDIKTKLIFKLFGSTVAQFDAMVANPASAPIERIVVAAQDVPQGFNVYFTQEIPVLLSGKYQKLPVQSIDLSTIDPSPANKTFYMYVELTDNIMHYKISTEKLDEELFRVYIGTIITGGSSITSITSEKVTRFLQYRFSTDKRGSAIPVSTGVPSGTGTRWN